MYSENVRDLGLSSQLSDKTGLTAHNGCPDKTGLTAHNGSPDKTGLTVHNGCPDKTGFIRDVKGPTKGIFLKTNWSHKLCFPSSIKVVVPLLNCPCFTNDKHYLFFYLQKLKCHLRQNYWHLSYFLSSKM